MLADGSERPPANVSHENINAGSRLTLLRI